MYFDQTCFLYFMESNGGGTFDPDHMNKTIQP